ncbi:MAG: helix-turn-helix transcriptional regulator [Myxococcota bacterium]
MDDELAHGTSSVWRSGRAGEGSGLEETRRARGLVSSRASGRRIAAGRVAPPEDLAFAVEALWWGAWDLRGESPHETRLLGDPCVHVVFEDDAESRVVGVWTRLWTRVLEGSGQVRGVKLRAGAVRTLFDVTASDLTNRIAPFGERSPDADELAGRVLAPPHPEAGLARLADWLRGHLRDDPESRRAVTMVERIQRGTFTRVEALAEATGTNVRALQRLFRRHVGAPPKAVIRRFRLQEAAARVEHGEAPDLATLAWELGYADQAHLARDFRAATGLTLRGFERGLDA